MSNTDVQHLWHHIQPNTEQGCEKLVPMFTHRYLFLLNGDSTSPVQMALEAKHKCYAKGDEFILTFTGNVL